MRRAALRVGAEMIPVLMVPALLAAALGLIVLVHRRHPPRREAPAVGVDTSVRPAPSSEAPDPVPTPSPPSEPPDDPTPAALAALAAREAEEARLAALADRLASSRVEAARRAVESARQWRRREMLIRGQLDTLDAQARHLEDQADALAHERDVLTRERDDLKDDLARARKRAEDGVAVLPYKGPSGTWRVPIAIECRNGTATLQPGGPSFTLLDLTASLGYRSNPLAVAIARRMARIETTPGPDGAETVPYILFVIRPDGIRPFYEARALLEPLGIAFGYELADPDWEVEFPDLTDLSEWPGTGIGADRSFAWPSDRPGPSSDAEFLRPATPPGGPGGMGPGTATGPGRPPARTGSMARPSGGGTLGEGLPDGPPGPLGSRPWDRGAIPDDGRVEIFPGLMPSADELAAAARDAGPGPSGVSGSGGTGGPPPPSGGSGHAGEMGSPRTGSGVADRLTPPAPGSLLAGLAGRVGGGPGAGTVLGTPDGSGAIPDPGTISIGLGSPDGGSGAPGGPTAGAGEAGPVALDRLPADDLELIVACRPMGVEIQPGGYALGTARLDQDGVFVQTLRAVVRSRGPTDPSRSWRPRLRFVVEPGGQETYWAARHQTVLAGLGWPVRLQVVEGTVPRLLSREDRP